MSPVNLIARTVNRLWKKYNQFSLRGSTCYVILIIWRYVVLNNCEYHSLNQSLSQIKQSYL